MGEGLRERANKAREFRCKNLIAVLENPRNLENIGSVVRNVDGLGVHKLYVIDGFNLLPPDWQTMRGKASLNKISVSAIKWAYVKRYADTKSCIDYLKLKGFKSFVTSPHLKGKNNCLLEHADFTDGKVAVWFGNESRGISDEAVENAECCVNITMGGIIESLNLGTCSGIVLYEATKQRRAFLALKRKLVSNQQMIKLIQKDKLSYGRRTTLRPLA